MARETIGRRTIRGSLAGVALLVAAASPALAQHNAGVPRARSTEPDITVEAVKRGVGPDVLVKGWGFTPGGRVRVLASTPPGAARGRDLGTVRADSTGRFVMRREEACTVTSAANLSGISPGRMTFSATDETTGRRVARMTSAGPWGC